MVLKKSYKSLLVALPLVLAACAGKGEVEIPASLGSLPPLPALDDAYFAENGYTKEKPEGDYLVLNSQGDKGGSIEHYSKLEPEYSWDPNSEKVKKFYDFYKDPEGNVYAITRTLEPEWPTGGNMPLREKQVLAYGNDKGKLLLCCEKGSFHLRLGSNLNGLRFGLWYDNSGKTDFLVAGVPADVTKLQGVSDTQATPTGKATYEVVAFRVKEGTLATSSANGASSLSGEKISSYLTVNFNANKVGGTLVGNAHFGDDIVFKDVALKGNRFEGAVASGDANGAVTGALFGTGYNTGETIGGIVRFESNTHLDAVFGGKVPARYSKQVNYEKDDTDHLK